MNIIDKYSFINDDIGYVVMKDNDNIDKKLPFVDDVEPRLIRFLRTLYYYRKHNITACIPLYMEFQIKKEDLLLIRNYILKYGITVFSANIKG